MPDTADTLEASDRRVRLEPVDRADVTLVMDNFVDVLMAGSGSSSRSTIVTRS